MRQGQLQDGFVTTIAAAVFFHIHTISKTSKYGIKFYTPATWKSHVTLGNIITLPKEPWCVA